MSANIAKPERTPLTEYLVSMGWTPRDAKLFIDRHWTLLGTATYDEWEDLSVEWAEAQVRP